MKTTAPGARPFEARSTAGALLRWYARHRRDLPWRRSRDPYRVWVSEVMLQQTTVRAVIPHYRRFLRRFPGLRALAKAPLQEVLAAWSGLGYYRRARHLHAAARRVMEAHAGRVPRTEEAMRALPGVGRYTAGAVLSICFGLPLPVVDGNVERVLSRLQGIRRGSRSAAGRRRLWDHAGRLVGSASSPGDLNQALMEVGATVCTPLSPACPRCPLARRCRARAAGLQEAIPPPRRARKPIVVRERVALVTRGGRLLLRRRGATGLMDGLWEFPALPAGSSSDGLRLRQAGRVATVTHSITFRRLRVQVHRATLLSEPSGPAYRWVRPDRIARLPVSSLVPKILRAVRD
jgi:A/G-specific adenine glycosylase